MRTVVLYGNSLAVSSLGACLRDREGLRVLSLGTGVLSEPRGPKDPQPDVVIFDLTATQPSFAVELLRSKPGLLLIGVDLANSKALVLSSQTSRVLTTDDLVRVIESHADTAEGEALRETQTDQAGQADAEEDSAAFAASAAHPETHV